MQLVHLKYFADIAELGSISAAALENFITCQGMSRALSALETELGCTLFDRKANGISLSSYGRAILPRVKQMLALQDEIVLDIAEVRSRGAAAGDATVVAYFNNVAFDSAFFGLFLTASTAYFPRCGIGNAIIGRLSMRFWRRKTAPIAWISVCFVFSVLSKRRTSVRSIVLKKVGFNISLIS